MVCQIGNLFEVLIDEKHTGSNIYTVGKNGTLRIINSILS